MKLKVKYSSNAEAIRARIRRLPEIYLKTIDGSLKADAFGMEKTFREGISKRLFRLQALSPVTIKKKIEDGFSKPRTPLYGKGESNMRTYLNMLAIGRIKNGWRVRVKPGMHWSGEWTLKELFKIHEFGATIISSEGVQRIPPRPAFNRAFNKWLRKKKKIDTSDRIRIAINELIRNGKSSLQKRIEEGNLIVK